MSLSDQLAARTKGGSNQGLPCSVSEVLATMPASERATFEEALAAPWRLVPHAKLERALKAEGYAIGVGSIGKHRRGDCRCAL